MARKRLFDNEELSPLSIRIPVSLRRQIEQSARQHRRSLNQEVILWLERAAQDLEAAAAGSAAGAAQEPPG